MALQPARSTTRLHRIGVQIGTRGCVQHQPAAAAASSPGSVLRLAFIGCGQICNAHLNALNAIAADLVHVTVCIDAVAARGEEMAGLVASSAAGHGTRPGSYASLAAAVEAGAEFDAVPTWPRAPRHHQPPMSALLHSMAHKRVAWQATT